MQTKVYDLMITIDGALCSCFSDVNIELAGSTSDSDWPDFPDRTTFSLEYKLDQHNYLVFRDMYRDIWKGENELRNIFCRLGELIGKRIALESQ